MKPCEQAHFIHVLYGGPHDGHKHPASRCYGWFKYCGCLYKRISEPEPTDPGEIQVLNCTDEYSEPVWFAVKMRYVP